MNPISHVKLFRGGVRLPDLDEPIVIVTFEQTKEEFFFAEYFILFQRSQRLDSCRFLCKESAREYLEIRPPEDVVEDVAESASLEIEAQVIEALPKEQQYLWVTRPAYTLTPIKLEDLRALWVRGRLEKPIRTIVNITRSMELKHELDQIIKLPHWTFTEEKPAG